MADFTASEVAEILLTLRTKLIRIFTIVLVVWVIAYAVIADAIILKIKADLLPEGAELIYRTPLEGMILKLKISLTIGFVVAIPYIVLLIYRTLKDRTEILENVRITKGVVIKYVTASIVLFVMGVAYGYVLLKFFLQYLYQMAANQGVQAFYSISDFINFVVLMLAIFGVIFQMPLIMLFLVSNDLVKFSTLAYYRRHFYVVFFVVGAIITPPDVFTQMIVALPMIIFFEVSMLVIKIVHRNKKS
jgi:sec-independent protein translocase protein TatC